MDFPVLRVPNSHLFFFFLAAHHLLSLSFMDMDGRTREKRGRGVGQCHPQSIIDANNYHIRRCLQWTDLAAAAGCLQVQMKLVWQFRLDIATVDIPYMVYCFVQPNLAIHAIDHIVTVMWSLRLLDTMYARNIVCSQSTMSRSISDGQCSERGSGMRDAM